MSFYCAPCRMQVLDYRDHREQTHQPYECTHCGAIECNKREYGREQWLCSACWADVMDVRCPSDSPAVALPLGSAVPPGDLATPGRDGSTPDYEKAWRLLRGDVQHRKHVLDKKLEKRMAPSQSLYAWTVARDRFQTVLELMDLYEAQP